MFDIENYPIISGRKEAISLINKVIKSYAKARPAMHQALISAVNHAETTRDTTLVTMLYDGLGDELNKGKGIATWLREFTNLEYRKAKDGSKQWLKPTSQPDVSFDKAGIVTPFWEMNQVKKDNEVPSMTNALQGFFSRFTKLNQEHKLSPVDAARLDYLKNAAGTFSAKEAIKYASEVVTVPAELIGAGAA